MTDLWAYGNSFIHMATVARPPFLLKHSLYFNTRSEYRFENGLAAKVLRGYVEDPFPVLSKEEKARMTAAHAALSRKFDELAFDESAEVRWQEAQPTEADNIDVGPVMETDLQEDFVEASGNPF
jgi:hypothetical protein